VSQAQLDKSHEQGTLIRARCGSTAKLSFSFLRLCSLLVIISRAEWCFLVLAYRISSFILGVVLLVVLP
jgi:hypothetical protein